MDEVAQLTNGLVVVEDVEDVDEAELPPALLIFVFDVEDVELELDELEDPEACWLAVAWSAAKMAADERFWPWCCGCGACGCGGGAWCAKWLKY